MDRLFRALADPARRAILERLSRGPAAVSELARPLPMSLPAAMQHLSVLELAGLVRSEKVGQVQYLRHRARGAQPGRAMRQRPADRVGALPRPVGRVPENTGNQRKL